ncbi:MAG: hypothetical protein RL641_769 [Candidatus Parcubacteria bacterium]|jgi:hypothetical protein
MATKKKTNIFFTIVTTVIIVFQVLNVKIVKSETLEEHMLRKKSRHEKIAFGAGSGIGPVKWSAFAQLNIGEVSNMCSMYLSTSCEGPRRGFTPEDEAKNSKVTTADLILSMYVSKWNSHFRGTGIGGFLGIGFAEPSYGNRPWDYGIQMQLAYAFYGGKYFAISFFTQGSRAFIFTSQDKHGGLYQSNTNSSWLLKYGARIAF